MSNFANYVMRGRKQAVIAALICTLVPFFDWLGIVIMGLVTLRKGITEGVIVLLWIMLPTIIMALLGQPLIGVLNAIGGSIVVWLLAIVLRITISWSMVLQIAALLGVVGIALVHGFLPNSTSWWAEHLLAYFQKISSNFDFELITTDLRQWASFMAQFASGVQADILLLAGLFNLFIARAWQAVLYNPGALPKELYNIRMPKMIAIVLVVFVLAAISKNAIVIDSLPVVALPFALAGLSLIHCLMAKTKFWWIWLSIFYGGLILFFPYVLGLLMALALADSWLDFRNQFKFKALS